ncbi:MAG: PilZ domain-containing protein [Actinomycetota bacterium]
MGGTQQAGRPEGAGAGAERRRHERVDAELRVRVESDGSLVEGRTVNVSEGGLAMDLPEAPDTARGIVIAIELADLGWQEIAGELRRSEPIDGGGVRLAARFAQAAAEGGPAAIREFIDRYLQGARNRL